MQPQAGHCRIEVSREEIFEVGLITNDLWKYYVHAYIPNAGKVSLMLSKMSRSRFCDESEKGEMVKGMSQGIPL